MLIGIRPELTIILTLKSINKLCKPIVIRLANASFQIQSQAAVVLGLACRVPNWYSVPSGRILKRRNIYSCTRTLRDALQNGDLVRRS